MAKLTAAQIRSIETVLYHLQRAQVFLEHTDVVVCRRKGAKTTTQDFVNDAGQVVTPISKDVGSELVGFAEAKGYLENFLMFNSHLSDLNR